MLQEQETTAWGDSRLLGGLPEPGSPATASRPVLGRWVAHGECCLDPEGRCCLDPEGRCCHPELRAWGLRAARAEQGRGRVLSLGLREVTVFPGQEQAQQSWEWNQCGRP